MKIHPASGERRTHRNAARFLAVALCAFTIFFVAISSSHIHAEGHGDAACRVCQVAHVGGPAAMGTSVLPAPLVVYSDLPCELQLAPFEQFFASSPSRAPPSA